MALKYLGSKRAVLPYLMSLVDGIGPASLLDAFSGTAQVAAAAKKRGLYVIANDTASYAYVLAKTFIETDAEMEDVDALAHQVQLTDAFSLGRDGFFTQKYSREARFFQEHNARRIDGILDHIRKVSDPTPKAVLQTSLLLAADAVDSTCGQFMAYLKDWSPRSYKRLHLQMPELLPGPGAATQMDALDAVEQLSEFVDLTYLDSPYNQHRYDANYHVWETLIRDDKPETYGVVNKRVNVRETKNRFNSKMTAGGAVREIISATQSPYLLVSFNNEGYVAKEELEGMLQEHGYTESAGIPHRRYVGASIGCYSPTGEKVGVPAHTRCKEYLFLSGPDQYLIHQAMERVRSSL